MDKPTRHDYNIVAFGVILFTTLWNIKDVMGGIGTLLTIVGPVLTGGVIAFVLNVPMTKINRILEKLTVNSDRKLKSKLPGLSLALTLVLAGLIIYAAGTMIIPPLINSSLGAISNVRNFIPELSKYLEQLGLDADQVSEALTTLQNTILSHISGNSVTSVVSSVTTSIYSTLGKIFEATISLIIAVYTLMEKDRLYRQCSSAAHAVLPEKIVKPAGRFWRMLCSYYARFFGGQCVEACILGLLMVTSFMIFRLPYAGLIATMTALFSFLPYIGSILSCIIGALLIAMISPMQALIFVAVFQTAQFCETQFIYPHVVGGAVGLPPLWTLVAVYLGGKAAGVIGVIFCIPLFSVCYTLAGEWVHGRLAAGKSRQTS
mgnify:CR=1 FL=1